MLNNMNITRARSTTLLTSNIVTTVKGYYINHVICFEFNILIMVSSTVLNTTTVLAYWKSSQLRKKTSYFLIMLLSFSDLGTVLGCSSMRSIILLRDMLGYERSSLTLPYIILMIVFFWNVLFNLMGTDHRTIFGHRTPFISQKQCEQTSSLKSHNRFMVHYGNCGVYHRTGPKNWEVCSGNHNKSEPDRPNRYLRQNISNWRKNSRGKHITTEGIFTQNKVSKIVSDCSWLWLRVFITNGCDDIPTA